MAKQYIALLKDKWDASAAALAKLNATMADELTRMRRRLAAWADEEQEMKRFSIC